MNNINLKMVFCKFSEKLFFLQFHFILTVWVVYRYLTFSGENVFG
jgi:hypothetical protein